MRMRFLLSLFRSHRINHNNYMKNKRLFYTITCICAIGFLLFYNLNFLFSSPYLWNGANEDISGYLLKSRCSCRPEVIEINRVRANNTDYYDIQVKKSNTNNTAQRVTVLKRYRIPKTEFETITVTCDLYSTLRRGFGQKVIGFSLFGQENFYYNFLTENMIRAARFMPGWVIRVYHDGSINRSVVCEKQCLTKRSRDPNATHDDIYYDNIDFCDVEKLPYGFESTWSATYMIPMSWRWLPVGDSFVDVFVSRDTDSCINERETSAVNEWLASNTLFHIMRGIFK